MCRRRDRYRVFASLSDFGQQIEISWLLQDTINHAGDSSKASSTISFHHQLMKFLTYNEHPLLCQSLVCDFGWKMTPSEFSHNNLLDRIWKTNKILICRCTVSLRDSQLALLRQLTLCKLVEWGILDCFEMPGNMRYKRHIKAVVPTVRFLGCFLLKKFRISLRGKYQDALLIDGELLDVIIIVNKSCWNLVVAVVFSFNRFNIDWQQINLHQNQTMKLYCYLI